MDVITTILVIIMLTYVIGRGIFKFLYTRILQKKCAWCSVRKIKYVKTEDLGGMWLYKNKDGTPDKRRKNNWVDFGEAKHFRCLDCNAITSFQYLNSISFQRRTLEENGSGVRTGKDWSAFWIKFSLIEILTSVGMSIIGLILFAVAGIFVFGVIKNIFF